jgi:hypothetical protein
MMAAAVYRVPEQFPNTGYRWAAYVFRTILPRNIDVREKTNNTNRFPERQLAFDLTVTR